MADDRSSVDGPGSGGDDTRTDVGPVRAARTGGTLRAEQGFSPGQVVADRYEVEKFLARGGMGEVYRVLDRELGERVALKVILPRSLHDPVTLDRFRREIQMARRVSHRNVCRIFDLGHHLGGDGGDVVFLTMELLEGISLREQLREGNMAIDEALDVIDQLCVGLGAAHRQGIVHRDLKPSNIFLVPGDDGTRVVIADFGLARTEDKEEGQDTVTITGEILGTPAYMAPEQMEGDEATAASDIYALGLVMYEMLTGARPFEGDSAFKVALNKLHETPTSPSSRVRGLPPRWDRTILRCLEPDPEDRFVNVEDIPAFLAGERRIPGRAGSTTLRRAAIWFAVATALFTSVVVVLELLPNRPERPSASVAAVDLRNSVAVLGFENVTGNPATAWVSDTLGDLLIAELGSSSELRVIPDAEVERARTELGIERVTMLGPETLVDVRRLLGADFVVLGSYAVFGEAEQSAVRLEVRVQDIGAGEIIILPTVTGIRKDLESIAVGAAGEIRVGLGLGLEEGADQTAR